MNNFKLNKKLSEVFLKPSQRGRDIIEKVCADFFKKYSGICEIRWSQFNKGYDDGNTNFQIKNLRWFSTFDREYPQLGGYNEFLKIISKEKLADSKRHLEDNLFYIEHGKEKYLRKYFPNDAKDIEVIMPLWEKFRDHSLDFRMKQFSKLKLNSRQIHLFYSQPAHSHSSEKIEEIKTIVDYQLRNYDFYGERKPQIEKSFYEFNTFIRSIDGIKMNFIYGADCEVTINENGTKMRYFNEYELDKIVG